MIPNDTLPVVVLISAAAGGLAAAYRWIRVQIERESKSIKDTFLLEIQDLKRRVAALEARSSGARSKIMEAYGIAVAKEENEISDLLRDADALLRGD